MAETDDNKGKEGATANAEPEAPVENKPGGGLYLGDGRVDHVRHTPGHTRPTVRCLAAAGAVYRSGPSSYGGRRLLRLSFATKNSRNADSQCRGAKTQNVALGE